MSIATGTLLGRYEIRCKIGAGGMGEVYLAKDTTLERIVALKILRTEVASDEDRMRRFVQEAKAAAALNHPNIAHIYDIGEADGAKFMTMEFIDGVTLREKIHGDKTELRKLLEYLAQVARGLGKAHEAGIVHRDLKPDNVMITGDGYAKVLDFGLAKLVEPQHLSSLGANSAEVDTLLISAPQHSTPGMVLGTLGYMSPEQAQGKVKKVDRRSDIFSFGCLLYEAATKHRPFEADSAVDTLHKIVYEPAPPIRDFNPVAPPGLQRIVRRCMAKDPEERFQNIRDVVLELEDLLLERDSGLGVNRHLQRPLESRAASGATPTSVITPRGRDSQPNHGDTNHVVEPVAGVTGSQGSSDTSGIHEADSQEIKQTSGAVPLNSNFYIVRDTDADFLQSIKRRDSIVLVKGARQMGKTSLLARGLQQARMEGAAVVLTDFQKLNAAHLESIENFFLALSEMIYDQLDVDTEPEDVWSPRRGPSINFERYIRRVVLKQIGCPLVWAMDEVDRLLTCQFGSEVFGLFRSWHNERSLDPSSPWEQLTLAIVYATEPHLFITDPNQSPFNVGTKLELRDFTVEQTADLNERYGAPLNDETEVSRYYQLVGGHPYLVHSGIFEIKKRGLTLQAFEELADEDEGPFGDHLRRILVLLARDPALTEAMREVLRGKPCPTTDTFYRLRSTGLVSGHSAREATLRCPLYAKYLERQLL
ncbi:MAG TPA: serine/threonine-protein kinase [Pyrinomonadaceae bacterium]|nr:serine/threonine-protein kinase [Pyrinomonadaceae bacterium]